MIIKILAEGGSMSPGPALSQKLGPVGINIGEVINKVNEATKNFKGMKVPVELDVDVGTKEFEVKVFSPPVSELLKKELGIEKGSGLQKKQYAGNISIEQVISIAKTKLPNLLCNNLKTAVKNVIGTCASLGILVENQLAADLGHQIAGGKFGKEIEEEKTETPEEKKKKLDEYFKAIQKEQEKLIKQEQEAEEAKKEKPVGETKTEEKVEDKKEEKK
ncbi:MAG: 50S ribosomal protein L11 [Nanoarchaeota archaeon]|nr:50S ribosomal protein L11 [Nanoarchaeota archaeon]MBU1028350.1 50S ribosomal protein L11 [Nanoarchaeota archaeon]